jgi:YidC/Oxa1 family membrane protein insertase
MQQKNLIAFLVISALILVGWAALQHWLSPPRTKLSPALPEAKVPFPPRWAGFPASVSSYVSGSLSVPGLGTAGPLAAEAGVTSWTTGAWPRSSTTVRLPYRPLWGSLPGNLEAVLDGAGNVPGLGSASRLATSLALTNLAAGDLPRLVVRKPSEQIDLGNDAFNLKATLTTQGGGVRSVTLTKFEAADRFGRPEKEDDGKTPPLALVPADPREPSHLFYHYADPEANHPDHPDAALGELEWTVKSKRNGPHDPVHEVVFTCEVPGQGITISKTYTLARGDYHLGLALKMELTGNRKDTLFRYELTGAHAVAAVDDRLGRPLASIEGEWYTTVYRQAMIGLVDGKNSVWRDLQTSQAIGFQGGGKDVQREEDKFIRYAAVVTQFFASAIVVDDQQGAGVDSRFPKILAWARPTLEFDPDPKKQAFADITVRVISEPVVLKAGRPVVHKYLLYNGPIKVRLLGHLEGDKAVPDDLVNRYEHTLHLDNFTDSGSLPQVLSWWTALLVQCTNLMHGLLFYLHKWVMPFSYGLCIVLLTVLVRGLMFPLSRKQAIASARMQEKMQQVNQELAPEFKRLEEKHKNDAMALRQAKNELMMKRGVNPMAMMGSCWLVFAQMPIFMGLYYALQESIHFRLAPFLWIRNLAAPDMLIKWGESIPVISAPDNMGSFLYLGPYFNLLPIIAVTLMIVQQKMMTPPPADEQQAMQQKMMKYMMIFFGLMFYKVAAGLCLYFIASNLWSLAERKLLPKKKGATASAPASPAVRKTGTSAPARAKTRSAKGGKGNGDGAMQKVSGWWAEVLKQAKKK